MQQPQVYRIPKQSTSVAQLPDALLRRSTVAQVTGLSDSSIKRKIRAGVFPAPVRLSVNCSRWRSADVTAWIRTVGA
jgi:prophage regulatory protein